MSDGTVSVCTEHFSDYILLNKAVYARSRDEKQALIDAAEDIAVITVDDGIPDCYNQLIYDGILTTGTGTADYIGYGLGSSADLDGDGLLNGEEIRIITPDGGYAYIEVLSDPTIKDTDGDGYDDYTEVKSMGTDPKADTYDGSAVNDLRTMWFTVLLPCLSWWRKINMNQDIMTTLLHWELCHLPHRKKYIRVFGWII